MSKAREEKSHTSMLLSCEKEANSAGEEEGTVFENHRKCLILHCEQSEQRLHFEWTKVH